MTMNESSFDRAFRIVLGTILLALIFVGPRTAWGWIGLLPLATGLAGYCPLYRLVGVKSCPVPPRSRSAPAR